MCDPIIFVSVEVNKRREKAWSFEQVCWRGPRERGTGNWLGWKREKLEEGETEIRKPLLIK